MIDAITLEAKPREKHGSHAAYQLRKQGLIPAVIYGHKEKTISVTLNRLEFLDAFRKGAKVLKVKLPNSIEQTWIHEIQYDNLGSEILHVDLQRAYDDEKVIINVRVELRGLAPGASGGGVVDHQMHTIKVECLVVNQPDAIRVNIDHLQLNQAIHVKELTFPTGVKPMVDPDLVVVQCKLPGAEPIPTTEPGANEPEVVGRKKAEKDEASEEKPKK